jgi:hypothetical protein
MTLIKIIIIFCIIIAVVWIFNDNDNTKQFY